MQIKISVNIEQNFTSYKIIHLIIRETKSLYLTSITNTTKYYFVKLKEKSRACQQASEAKTTTSFFRNICRQAGNFNWANTSLHNPLEILKMFCKALLVYVCATIL